ncbi:hypothetical protein LJC14_06460, partial [Treponema sp. OttesenSCG-928-L16]|nr:hypothetical protein [Treponema sp. OttesenSCG-928-L16]
PNLTKEIMPSITFQVKDRQVRGMPVELVKDYSVDFFRGKERVFSQSIRDNYQRLNVIKLKAPVTADRVCVHVHATHGLDRARIFEIRLY